MNHSVYIKNRTPHSKLGLKSPFEIYTGKKPDLSKIRIFGCVAYQHIDESLRKKFENSANRYIYVGNSTTSNTYLLFDKTRGTVIQSGMVKFKEIIDENGILKPFDRNLMNETGLENIRDEKLYESQINMDIEKITLSSVNEINDFDKIIDMSSIKENTANIAVVKITSPEADQPFWTKLSTLIGINEIGINSTKIYQKVSNFLKKNSPGLEPLFQRVDVKIPNGKTSKKVSGIIFETDFEQNDGCFFKIGFMNGTEFRASINQILTKVEGVLSALVKFGSNWTFDKNRFDKLNSKYGPHTVDACCEADGSNALLNRFWSEEDSALNNDWTGENVWCNPPFWRVEEF